MEVVIDYGSNIFRAGYATTYPSEEEPRLQTPNAVQSFPQGQAASMQPSSLPDGSVQLLHPIQRGEICNMDALESLIHYSFYEMLGWELGNEGNVVVAEPLMTSRKDRELLGQLMFEVFNVEGLFCQDQASLALYALGKLTGMVVDVGHGKIDVATVSEGQVNISTVRRLGFGGQEVTEYLQQLLSSKGIQLNSSKDAQALKELCSKVCESREEFQQLGKPGPEDTAGVPSESTFTLPDGQQFTLTTEGAQITEALLDPGHLRSLPSLSPALAAWASGPGLGEVVAECLTSTIAADFTAKKAGPAKDILVCGGGGLIPGLGKRLVREVRELGPAEPLAAECKIPEYMPAQHSILHAAWLGGAILGKVLVSPPGQWVSRWDYEEVGPPVISRKCG